MSSSIDKKSLRILISDSESDSEVKSRSDKNSSQKSSKQSQSSNKSSSLRPKSGYKGEDKKSNAIIESSDDDDFNSNKNKRIGSNTIFINFNRFFKPAYLIKYIPHSQRLL